MSALAVIPARGGSKGILGKNIRIVDDISLIERAVNICIDSEVEVVVVSTDCPDIKDAVSGYDVIVIDRPDELSTDTASSESAVVHAIEELGYGYDHTLMVQCTSPLLLPEDINGVIEQLESGCDCAFTASKFHGFVWDGKKPINHSLGFRPMRQTMNQFIETGAVYGFDTEQFLQFQFRFFGEIGMHVIPEERSLEIDDPWQLEVAEAMLMLR